MPAPLPSLPVPAAHPTTDEARALLEPFMSPSSAAADLAEAGRAYLGAGRDLIHGLHRAGAAGRTVVRAHSELVDRFVQGAFAKLGGPATGAAIAALGGYGRRELAPKSDVDLLVLAPAGDAKAAAALGESLVRVLWDAGLEVGYGFRTVKESVKLALEDHVARTALVDLRSLGPKEGEAAALFAELEQRVVTQLETRRVEEFIADKIAETKERRARYGESIYLLEPNLKQGEGGLRDLQASLWIARARYKVEGLSSTLERGLLPEREIDQLRRARDLLWRLRAELHYLARRREDRLTFDAQLKAAAALGYVDEAPEQSGLGVEQLMRHYYLAARTVVRISDDLVDRCAREAAPRKRPGTGRALTAEFKVWDDRLTVTDRDVFARDPAALVRAFAVAERERLELYSYARDLIASEALRLSDVLPSHAGAHAELWSLLCRDGSTGQALRELHSIGLLAAMFPELARLAARVQHDLYHAYTVDQHTVNALVRLTRLRAGEYHEEEPVLTRLARSVERWLPLALGLLFHDLGKASGSDHSKRGEVLARAYAARTGLATTDAAAPDDVAWLVAQHLAMSHISQKRDLSDPHLLERFARECGTVERLDLLTVMTYADVASVGPTTWTEWKRRLLLELHDRTRAALLAQGLAAPPAFEARGHRQRAILAGLEKAGVRLEDAQHFVAALPERYVFTADPAIAPHHFALVRRAATDGYAGELQVDARSGEAVLTLCAPDRPGLLAAFAGALAAHRIDILGAEVFSVDVEWWAPPPPRGGEAAALLPAAPLLPSRPAQGMALDVFRVREPGGSPPTPGRWAAAEADLRKILAGDVAPRELLRRRTRAPLGTRTAPRVALKIRFDNASAARHTVVDLYAQDRPGLLFTIAETLHRCGVTIALARVATEGNKATDSFYVAEAGAEPSPITSAERLAAVEAALVAALTDALQEA